MAKWGNHWLQCSTLCCPFYGAESHDNTELSTAENVVKLVAMHCSYEPVSICYEWILHSVEHHELSRQYRTTRLALHEIYCDKQYFNAQRSNKEFDKYNKTWLQGKEYHLLGCDTVQSDRQVQFEKKTLLSSAG
jgi:hypothetical protein